MATDSSRGMPRWAPRRQQASQVTTANGGDPCLVLTALHGSATTPRDYAVRRCPVARVYIGSRYILNLAGVQPCGFDRAVMNPLSSLSDPQQRIHGDGLAATRRPQVLNSLPGGGRGGVARVNPPASLERAVPEVRLSVRSVLAPRQQLRAGPQLREPTYETRSRRFGERSALRAPTQLDFLRIRIRQEDDQMAFSATRHIVHFEPAHHHGPPNPSVQDDGWRRT
jgi:hypothetical protein